MRCVGCNRELAPGDQYIEDTASGFTKNKTNPDVDALVSEIMGGSGTVIFCSDCTQEGGEYELKTFYD